MKRIPFYILVYILIFILSPLVSVSDVKAAGSIYLSPGGATIAQGSSFSVSVRVNTGGKSVDSVQANLSYQTDKLDFIGISYGGTEFEIQAESSGGSGSVRMGRGTLSAKSGDVLVGTITFSAKVNSGSAAVSFTSGTVAVKAGATVVSATSGGTYSFTKPTPAAKPKPKDKTAPKISDVKVTDIGLEKATVTWKTNEETNSSVEYGPTKSLGLLVSSSKLTTTHKIALSSKILIPGTKFYYVVKSKDTAGNEAKSKLTSFKTKGYTIVLKILAANGKSLTSVLVTLIPGLENATTDQNGVATFKDIAPGIYAVHVLLGNSTLGAQIEVKIPEDPTKPQEFAVQVAGTATTAGKDTLVKSIALIAVIIYFVFSLGFIAWWFIERRLGKSEKRRPREPKSPTAANTSNLAPSEKPIVPKGSGQT
ncbi:MAG: hypothetical protein A2Z11_00780 [Candidatus Woykebacteria bacterium RBG_16_43_9]|uniref:Cohesin domain-containing protein n=1 Tax=Candidatus Woykebacteria bacterium RBG_16_43_9 TaxID=1802596 RepID=A0A1G1WCG2_9BACT|nr:MAG: hypothetical protein A2Z11_00780 [Candidatus Woykebacteria bacterium RBG_16_43_9]